MIAVREPSIRIMSGRPTPIELAAVLVAIAAATRQAPPRPGPRPAPATPGGWGDPAHAMRRPLHPLHPR